jgi:hypothetical protein
MNKGYALLLVAVMAQTSLLWVSIDTKNYPIHNVR